MKNLFFLLISATLSGCFGRQPTVITGMEGKPLPSFNLLLMDSSTLFNTKNIPSDKPIVFFFFSPTCPYCRAQTEEMIDNIKSLSTIQFYMLSSFPFDDIKKYDEHYQLKKYSNITVGQDYNFYVSNYFKAPGIPYMAIYNKEKKLKQVLMGNVGTDLIRDIAF